MYSSELKERLVQLASEGVPILQLERDYEPTASTIHAWIKAAKQDPKAVEAEQRRLRRENQRLKEINQILEKAKVWTA